MSKIEELADRVERLLLRHGEVRRTNALLREQVAAVTLERDNMRSRLNAARARIETLLERLPGDSAATAGAAGATGAAPATDATVGLRGEGAALHADDVNGAAK